MANNDKKTTTAISALDKLHHSDVTLKDPRYDIYYSEKAGYDGPVKYNFYSYNGATIDTYGDEANPVKYEIIYHDETQTFIDCLRLTLHDKRKMGDIFYRLPYGIIKKNIPGIGATTLALQQDENTIIVVPTRALAYAKYITGYNKDRTQNRYFYVGSDINECSRPTDKQIYEYITQDIESHCKKIIVVADSLSRVMHFIDRFYISYRLLSEPQKEQRVHIKDLWTIMIDEIDSYQSDGVYRPAMEDVIDYYFTFPLQSRCLVSATIRPFSNPLLQKEPTLELCYEETDKRDITLCHTNNIHIEVCETIKQIRQTAPAEKIVVAYNSITSIQKIIALLPQELQEECGIACSPGSRMKAGDSFTEIKRTLDKTITFITCTYFVGVDIEERFHLISVSDIRQIYTILSIDKLYQISGRCRHKDGVLSETIIYNSTNRMPKDYGELLESQILDLCEDICKLSNVIDSLYTKHPELTPQSLLLLKEDVIDRTKQSYFGSNPIEIVRKNKEGELVPAYFNIDAIREYAFLRGTLYSHPDALLHALTPSCVIIAHHIMERETTIQQQQIEASIDMQIETNREQQTAEVIEKLKKLHQQGNLTDASITQLQRGCSRESSQFIDRFVELYKYVPFDILTTKLQEGNAKSYKGFLRSVKYLALPNTHPFKQLIKENFEVHKRYSQSDVLYRLNKIFRSMDIPELKGTRQAIQELHRFCTTTRPDHTYLIIQSHSPALGFEPLTTASDTGISLRHYFGY